MWVRKAKTALTLGLAGLLCALVCTPLTANAAINPLPIPPPGSGSYGLEATKKQPPPTVPATISIPAGGATSTSPITVSGICQTGLLVEIFVNDVMAGSVNCVNGSFSLQVSLFSGDNQISAMVFDDLDQAGPKSNVATITYNNTNFKTFADQITLTSNYGRRGAAPGTTLTWPLELSGGQGPYAFSIDWGDGSPVELKSQGGAGLVTLSHVYSKSGIYHVSVKVTDVNGTTSFIQLVAIANGNISASGNDATTTETTATASTPSKALIIPAVVSLIMLVPAFALGRMSMSKHR
jgi:hypothetical protein